MSIKVFECTVPNFAKRNSIQQSNRTYISIQYYIYICLSLSKLPETVDVAPCKSCRWYISTLQSARCYY